MSGYSELTDLGVTFRPFDGPVPRGAGKSSPFDASWGSTVELLARELRHLDARQIVLEVAGLGEGDLRLDGLPRANAVLGDAVRISFESKWGPQRYATAEFTRRYWSSSGSAGWQANVRAIALSLEALRKVDRYGVSKRGEQYQGWKALPQSTDPADSIQTQAQAQALIDSYGGIVAALKETHPDRGGNPDEFRKVARAKELLGA